MIAPNPSGPATTQGNLLLPFAWALFQLRAALDEAPSGRSPRWVRLARGGALGDQGVGAVIRPAVGLLLKFIGALHNLLLDLQDVLIGLDAPKAAVELLLEMGKAATAPELVEALSALLGDNSVASSLAEANRALRTPDQLLDVLPEPGDVDIMGRQIFELICVDPAPGDAPSRVDLTGRLRLLSWAYGLPINVPAHDLAGKGGPVPVAHLGVRARHLMADEGPVVCADVWPGAGGRAIPLYRLDLAGGEDLDEVTALLDTLGYSIPTIERGVTRLSGAHTVRLRVFQILNDLPVTGDLDAETLHRLLGLDRVQRTIARPRPYNPARWKRVPKAPPRRQEVREQVVYNDVPVYHTLPEDPLDQGKLSIVNPDADHYTDEGIALIPYKGKLRVKQSEPRAYYLAGAPVIGQDAKFPAGVKRGWIRHLPDDDWLFQEKDGRPPAFGCCFVGLETRPLAPSQTEFEGGELSEGAAFGRSRFFFSAREVEPWISGRSGNPGGDNLSVEAGWPEWKSGSVSGLYQWVPLGAELKNTAADERLYVRATAQMRSLYKERGGGGGPDKGRIVLGLVRQGAIDLSRQFTARFSAAHLSAWAWTGWWPQTLQASLESGKSRLLRGEEWIQITTPGLLVTADTVGIFIGLYGRHQLNHDTDAYFDDVEVTWWREPVRSTAPRTTSGGAP